MRTDHFLSGTIIIYNCQNVDVFLEVFLYIILLSIRIRVKYSIGISRAVETIRLSIFYNLVLMLNIEMGTGAYFVKTRVQKSKPK